MKISLWLAKDFVECFHRYYHSSNYYDYDESKSIPSDIIAGAITEEHHLQTFDFTALRKSEYLQELDEALNKSEDRQRILYEYAMKPLKKIDESYNAAARFAIAFCTLLETDQVSDYKLDLFTESFLYMEKNQLPT